MARRTKEERIAALEAQIQKLKNKSAPVKAVKLDKASPGMTELIASIESVAEQNSVSVAEIIKAVARIKRTGLKIDDAVRKSTESAECLIDR
jgi:hypothetical protein